MLSFWPRINTILLLVALLAVIGLFATRAFGGPLDPPGPLASTDGVHGPGTPISSLPFTTTEGGYFYVTRDLSAGPGQSGITICCSNTTLDLGGFTLFGPGAASPGDGISNAGARNIVIRNGAVRGFANGINLGGTYSRVEHVLATSNLQHGIIVGPGSEVADCTASINGLNGIVINAAVVRNCTVMENSNFGIDTGATNSSLIEHNRISANTGYGISIGGSFNMILNNQLSGNISKDVSISFEANSNVLNGNVLCTAFDFGTGTVLTDNWC